MRRRRIGERTLSSRIPEDVRQTRIKVADFCSSLEVFSREYLKGAIAYEGKCKTDGYITACSFQSAYALRVAVMHGADDTPVRVTVREEGRELLLHVVIADSPDPAAIAEMIRALTLAGFSALEEQDGICAHIPLERDKLIKIYAKSRNIFIQDLYAMFFV